MSLVSISLFVSEFSVPLVLTKKDLRLGRKHGLRCETLAKVVPPLPTFSLRFDEALKNEVLSLSPYLLVGKSSIRRCHNLVASQPVSLPQYR